MHPFPISKLLGIPIPFFHNPEIILFEMLPESQVQMGMFEAVNRETGMFEAVNRERAGDLMRALEM